MATHPLGDAGVRPRFVGVLLVLAACAQDHAAVPRAREDAALGTAEVPVARVDAGAQSSLDASAPSGIDAAVGDADVVRTADASAALDDDTLLTLGAQLISLCPSAAPDDAAARERCADGLVFLFEGQRLVAAVRSEQTDPGRPHSMRSWDGAWTWNQGQEPHVTLFRALFSPSNPYVAALDESYRALAVGLREQTCTACHSPDNAGMAKPLDILNYPNQSLSGRHRIVSMLDTNQMPPDVGIADASLRASLLEQARTFARLGDQALTFEGEPTASPPRL